jgi:hypothetical protein
LSKENAFDNDSVYMRKINRLGCLGLGVLLSAVLATAYADDTLPPNSHLQDIATITNSRDASSAVLSIILGPKDEVLGVYDVYSMNDGSGEVTRRVLTLSQIASSNGASLYEENGLTIFILQGSLDASGGSASLEIRYLANGLTRNYDSCRINAKRSPQGTWSLINAYDGRVVTEARARAWKLGIKTIENVCPTS